MLKILSFEPETWLPLTGNAAEFKIGGISIADLIRSRFNGECTNTVTVRSDFIPSPELAELLAGDIPLKVISPDDNAILAVNSPAPVRELFPDENSLQIRYPWDLLRLNELLLSEVIPENYGIIREHVCVDGAVKVGECSVLLPGVFIEGNVIIGKNCKIGPNCYIRGNTSIGDRCHIGQAVEIKNSILADHVSIGHLSYVGDSIIASDVNFGAGTIISNLRHDNSNHRCMNNGHLIPTGRRKFGAVIGQGVHTGIHTAIYPGRTLSGGSFTLPGETVKHSR